MTKRVYHGTTTDVLQDIQINGFKMTGKPLYFTTNKEDAQLFAKKKYTEKLSLGHDMKPVIIEVLIDENLLEHYHRETYITAGTIRPTFIVRCSTLP